MIDGKLYVWQEDRTFWVPDVSSIVANPPSDVSVVTGTTGLTSAEQLANLANTRRAAEQISSTMGNLLRSFNPT